MLGAKSITHSDPMISNLSGSVAAAALAKAGILDESSPDALRWARPRRRARRKR